MSEEECQQEMSEWTEMMAGPDGNFVADEQESGAAEKEVIDLEGEEGKKRKQMTSRSEMWDHFSKIFEGGEVVKGKCNYCSREIQATSKNGTSAMRKHFNCCKHNPHVDSKQGVISISQGTSVGTWKYDPDLLRSAFAEMIIEDEEPFAKSEKPGFRKFMSIACPRFDLPSRRTCTRDCVELYFQQKAKLKIFFQEQCNRVCLTTDGWTSQQQESYMTVTAHFIDKDWCLHKKIISFCKVKGKKGMILGNTCRKSCLTGG
jgi:hypothetical protein